MCRRLTVPCRALCLLEFPDGRRIPCHSAYQAYALARLWVALTTGAPASSLPMPNPYLPE